MNFTELDAAKRIRDELLPSPFKFSNMWLVNLRITGTGLCYRDEGNEHAWRSPDFYLNNQFLERCNGLPVIAVHPDKAVLDEREFHDRIVGVVMLPYIRTNEVWAIARIYPQWVVDEIAKGGVSTSPAVIFNKNSGNITVSEGDANFLIEGVPYLIDHIALVPLGVWDKDGQPKGVEVTQLSDEKQIATVIKAAVDAAFNPAEEKLAKISERLNEMERIAAA